MYYFIIDLEATCWKFPKTREEQEIIEIGAIAINAYGEECDRFQSLVKPFIHPRLSYFCEELTGITQSQVDHAPDFVEVFDQFILWVENYDHHYFSSWGAFDEEMLRINCFQNDLDPFWKKKFANLKKQYQLIKKLRKPIGLKSAVEREGFEFTGRHHRALSDAENTAKIFNRYLDEWIFE
ncbi:MAG: 3'-5' exonuclease [Saprospirales bacterium]|nr:MAG: 3'-5' exonuclease [Saprospirales bacterium]